MLIKKHHKSKGVSKVVIKGEIKHSDYIRTMNANEQKKRNIVAIRSNGHQFRTIINKKVALNSFHNRMNMVSIIDCIPCGYKVQQSSISSMVEYVQKDNDNDLSEMGKIMFDSLGSNMNRSRARSSWE